MTGVQRQQKFETAIKELYSVTSRDGYNVGWGVSNRALMVDHGIQLGNFNLGTEKPDASQHVLVSYLDVPPYSQVYFAVQVKTQLTEFNKRLTEMVRLASAGESRYGSENNNVRVYLNEDGKLYLLNKEQWFDLRAVDLSLEGPPISPDSLAVAVYSPTGPATRRIAAQELVAYIEGCVGKDKVQQISPWLTINLPPAMQRLPPEVSIDEVKGTIVRRGGHFMNGLIERYHAGMCFHPRKHFVILSGLSGTGKTRLALDYATAIHASKFEPEDNPHLFVCPVRPDWTDPSGLLGYLDVLSGRYIVPPFLKAVLTAAAHPDSPVFVILDEMNLARVEHYLSDVLSAMESGAPLRLHSGETALQGDSGEEIRGEMPLPSNLYITGTINIDESTLPISDKVLDRAVIIDMSDVDLPGFLDRLTDREPSLEDACKTCRDLLEGANGIMSVHRQGFGYRTAEEFVRYFHFATSKVGYPPNSTLDELLVQKIFPKLRGGEKQRRMLHELLKLTEGMPESQKLLNRLIEDLDELGSFQNTR